MRAPNAYTFFDTEIQSQDAQCSSSPSQVFASGIWAACMPSFGLVGAVEPLRAIVFLKNRQICYLTQRRVFNKNPSKIFLRAPLVMPSSGCLNPHMGTTYTKPQHLAFGVGLTFCPAPKTAFSYWPRPKGV